jgi:hypothetical protein
MHYLLKTATTDKADSTISAVVSLAWTRWFNTFPHWISICSHLIWWLKSWIGLKQNLKSCCEFDYFSPTQSVQDTKWLTYRPKRKQTKYPPTVTRPPVDNTASSGDSQKTTLSSKPTKPKPTATAPSTAKDDPKDKDFAPPKNPRPCSESSIEDIPLNKYGNEIVEDLPPVRYFAVVLLNLADRLLYTTRESRSGKP